jgi:hypothetical protein
MHIVYGAGDAATSKLESLFRISLAGFQPFLNIVKIKQESSLRSF